MSPIVTDLALTCESEAKQVLDVLTKDLTPADGVYQNTLENASTKDLIPWLGKVDSLRFFVLLPAYLTWADLHLSTLNSSFVQSNPIVEVDGHYLIDFQQCSKVAEQIEALVQYSPPRTRNTTRPDVLEYVEYSLKSSNGDNVMHAINERSAKLAGEERSFLEHRKRMQALGFPWSPPRRK
jgi:hypothetical protein